MDQTQGPAAERKAVATITMGRPFEAMAKLTHPLMQRYAERCGADFVVINERKVHRELGLEKYERFQLHELLLEYDRIVYIDTDILVSPDAPSVFEKVPRDRIGVASEERYSQADRDKRVTQEQLGPVNWANPYFNSGMMVVSREHRDIFDPAAEGLKHWATGAFRSEHVNLLNDQPYLNHRINALGLPVLDLGHRFNHTRVITETHTRFHSYFIHYSGPSGHRYGPRLHQIRKDAAVLNSRARLNLSRRSFVYRWIADRLDPGFTTYVLNERLGLGATGSR